MAPGSSPSTCWMRAHPHMGNGRDTHRRDSALETSFKQLRLVRTHGAMVTMRSDHHGAPSGLTAGTVRRDSRIVLHLPGRHLRSPMVGLSPSRPSSDTGSVRSPIECAWPGLGGSLTTESSPHRGVISIDSERIMRSTASRPALPSVGPQAARPVAIKKDDSLPRVCPPPSAAGGKPLG